MTRLNQGENLISLIFCSNYPTNLFVSVANIIFVTFENPNFMNVVYRVFLMALMLIVASCSSDDDGPRIPPEEVIPGTWEVVESDSEFDAVLPGLLIITTISEGTEFEGEVIFSEDPNVWVSNHGGIFDVTIVVNFGGETETEEDTEVMEPEERTGTWMINEDGQLEGFYFETPAEVEFDLEDFYRYDVEVVTNDRIILTNEAELTETDPSTGLDFNITGTSRIVMERK